MSKKKKKENKKKNKLNIPRTVEEAERNLDTYIPAGWNNAPLIKTQSSQFEKEQIKELAEAIYEYMAEKDITQPGGSWQDYLLIQMLRQVYKKSTINELMLRKGENAGMAELKAVYEDLPSQITASDDEIEKIIKMLSKDKKDYEGVAYSEIVSEIAKLRGIKIEVESLKQRNILNEIGKIVDVVIAKHQQSKWIIFIEGIIIGLISNGIFELLKGALSSLVMRAPYTEAQIYEVESDVVRHYEIWKQTTEGKDEFEEKEREITLFYVLHAICVLSVLGKAVPKNPLFNEG